MSNRDRYCCLPSTTRNREDAHVHTATRRLVWTVTACLLAATAAAPLFAQQPPPAEGDEATLIAVLESADATLFDKAKACQALAVKGTRECIPVLSGLLDDPELSHYARYGLEPMPEPAVDVALRGALGRLEGRLLVGVINSIGMRRDAGAVGELKELMGSSDAGVGAAAAAALGRIGTPEAVAALQGALGRPSPLRTAVADACLTAADRLLADGKSADAAEVYDAMRRAKLPKHLHIATLHGAIRARGREGLPILVECLRSEDKGIFRTGLRMAQEIGGPEAARTLVGELELPETVEKPAEGPVIERAEYGVGDRWVDVTEQVVAAARSGVPIEASNDLAGDPAPGVVKKLRVVYTKDGQEHSAEVPEGEQIALDLEGVAAVEPHPRQVMLIYALGDLGQQSALPAVLEAAESGAWDIRRAAIRVLGKLGDASAVPALLAAAVEGAGLSQVAQQSLVELEGKDVDAALAKALAGAEGKRRIVLIRLAGERGIASAVPALKQAADAEEPEVATAAIEALGTTIGLGDLSVLIDRLVDPRSPEEAATAKDALGRAVLRMPDRDATAAKLVAAMAAAPGPAKVDLLDLLGAVGGAKALEAVAAAAKGGDEEMQDAATRVLGRWMSPAAAPVLLDLARTGNEKYRVRCLRGYLRIARQLDVPTEERVAMCRQALAVAGRDQEKALALEVLGRYPTAESLALVVPYLDSATLKGAAAAVAVAIAEEVVESHPTPVAEAMKKAAEAADAEVAQKARGLLRRAERKLREN